MNCRDLEAYLVDYLGGELEPGAVESVEAHLQTCPACAAEVRGLRGVVATLDATRLPLEAVTEISREIRFAAGSRGQSAHNAAPRTLRVRVLTSVLRYAAVIALAFYFGWWYRGDIGDGTLSGGGAGSATPIVVGPPPAGWRPEAINPQVAAGFEAASAAFPGSSSFSRSLLAFSRR